MADNNIRLDVRLTWNDASGEKSEEIYISEADIQNIYSNDLKLTLTISNITENIQNLKIFVLVVSTDHAGIESVQEISFELN